MTTPGGTERTVLVVDDTPGHRYVMASWLRRAGFRVLEAATGGEALRTAGPGLDAVVLDVNLPDVPGPEVCRRLKAAPATSHVPVLLVSATAIDAAARTAGLEGGADAYLTEPLDREEFLATVGALCRTRAAHRGTATTARRLERLTEALVPLHGARSHERVVDTAARGAAEVLGRPALAMVVVDATRVLRAVCDGDGDTVVRSGGASPVPPPAGTTESTFAPGSAPAAWIPLLANAGVPVQAWWTQWLHDDAGALVGGLAVGTTDDDPLTTEDVDAARRFTEAMTVALTNLRTYAEEHRIALTLQRTLLPSSLAVGDHVEVAARYEASDAHLDVGGDFYDAFELPDGRAALVIGDVQGHSLRAATVMAELRLTLRAYLREGHDAGRALDLLNDVLRADHPEFVTVCVCVLDRGTGLLEVTNAGHLPPFVLAADGAVRRAGTTSRLLGLPVDGARPTSTEQLAPGDTIVLVTDGLVERRTASLAHGLDLLGAALGASRGLGPDAVCDRLLRRFDDSREDDVAVVAARWAGGPTAA